MSIGDRFLAMAVCTPDLAFFYFFFKSRKRPAHRDHVGNGKLLGGAIPMIKF